MHPLAWWMWAGAAAVALTRVGNPVVLVGIILAVAGTAAVCREPVAGFAADIFSRTLEAALILGAVVILVRTTLYVLVGFPDSSPVLLELPSFDVPWFTNLQLLGPVHVAGFVSAVIEGVRLAGLIIVFGAAAAVSNPRRALRHLPSSLHHVGTAAVIAVAAAPQLVASVGRIRRAQRLRPPPAGKTSRVRKLAALLIPVLSGALDHSLALAGSMDSRGYARAVTSRRGVGAALVVALLAAAAGTYGLLDSTTPPGLGAALLTGGFALALGASVVASRSVRRTRYYAAPWGWRETLLAVSGVLVAAGAVVGTSGWVAGGLGRWRFSEPWPELSLLGAVMILAAAAPLVTRVGLRARVASVRRPVTDPGEALPPPASVSHEPAAGRISREVVR